MFNLISILLIAIIGVIGFFTQSDPNGPIHIIGIALLCIAGLWFFASLMNNFVCYHDQIARFENIIACQRKVKIYEEKRDKLLDEFKTYLSEKYTDIENEIFKKITDSRSDTQIVLTYPEIKSSETLMKLVEQINSQSSRVYDERMNLETLYAQVRSFNKNLWFYLKPSIPEDISKSL